MKPACRLLANVLFAVLVCMPGASVAQTVMQAGTIFTSANIITEKDPTTFTGLTYAGQGTRTVFDRRSNDWVTINAFLFPATFNDGLTSEVIVNPEFGTREQAEQHARYYAHRVGQLPTILRKDVKALWIHKGVQPFGGGNDSILIHVGKAAEYLRDGILEETLVHEAVHTSMDKEHAKTRAWINAQQADGRYISPYARENPEREDLAETFLMYLAVRVFADRVPADLVQKITAGIPNRLAYFDEITLQLHPYPKRQSTIARPVQPPAPPVQPEATQVQPQTTPGQPAAAPTAAADIIAGTYSASNGGGQLTIAVWGNGYYTVDWSGRRYTAYYYTDKSQLWLYETDPKKGWLYVRLGDGSFHHQGQTGQTQVLTRVQ